MFKREKINRLEDFFIPCSSRTTKGVYFCRIVKYNQQIDAFVHKYVEETIKGGVCISGKILNPDEKQLSYYDEIMGREFKLDIGFFLSALKKWLPRVQSREQEVISKTLYDILHDMVRQGKNENMLKNAYIKYMCWLYYKFESILHQLGKDNLPKIAYEGYPNENQLNILLILSQAGCDILLLEYEGDGKYLQVDPNSECSEIYQVEGTGFPKEYSILEIRKSVVQKRLQPNIAISSLERPVNTSAWMTGDVFEDVIKEQSKRGNDTSFYYNVFAGVLGVEDKNSYFSQLFKWKTQLEKKGKNLVLVENNIPLPNYEEIQKIKRNNYKNNYELQMDMQKQIVYSKDKQIELYGKEAFSCIMEENKDKSLQKLSNQVVILVCWIMRYLPKLFENRNKEQIPIFLFYGTTKTENESMFLRLLAKMPVDVLIINPDLSMESKIKDTLFFEKRLPDTLEQGEFPRDVDDLRFGTVAFKAEQELNTLLYQDTGLYRNRQFKRAMPITLQTTFEEIEILWEQDAVFRPNFETLNDSVIVPVVFAKISGVKGTVDEYWDYITGLIDGNTHIIKKLPYITGEQPNPFREKSYLFIRNGKVDIKKIKEHPAYPFSFIREEMQDYMLDKLQQLIEKRWIVGTGVTGTENAIISAVLNIDKEILRLIQKYDFTKAIPKLIITSTKEEVCSLEDSILAAYLNLIGFDVIIFVPTGYISIEKYYAEPIFLEHQVGEYIYDLNVPDFNRLKRRREGIASKIFRRGR